MDSEKMLHLLEKSLQNIFFEVHAVYEPDGQGIFGDCYCAAIDLFSWMFTFRVYFKIENDEIKIENIERWTFG